MVAFGAFSEQPKSAYDSVVIAASNFADNINFHVEASFSITLKFTAYTISVIIILYNSWRAIEYRIRSIEMQPVDIILMNWEYKHTPLKM